MPGGDKTGPQGEGPLTGRQAGYCNGSEEPGYAGAGYGRPGYGRRSFWRGRPRRGRWSAPAPVQASDERNSLLQEVRDLKEMVSGLSMPDHSSQVGALTPDCIRDSIMTRSYFFPQLRHETEKAVPWTSMIFSGVFPAR